MNTVSKDNNISFFRENISKIHYSLYNQELTQSTLDTVMSNYKELRNSLKASMFTLDETDNEVLESKRIDVHKIASCLLISIYISLKSDDKYYDCLLGYVNGLYLLKLFNGNQDYCKYKMDKPIFNKNKEYEVELYRLIANNIEEYKKPTISCIHNISHIFYLIDEIWMSQEVCNTHKSAIRKGCQERFRNKKT